MRPFGSNVLQRGLLGILCAACLLGAGEARASEAASPGATAKATLDFRVVIPTVLRVSALAQPGVVEITASDVARGYVDLDGATLVRLVSNTRRGMNVVVGFDRRIVSRVVVRVMGSEIVADHEGAAGEVPSERIGTQEMRVSYRLHLNPHTSTGTYPWPVRLAFSPALA